MQYSDIVLHPLSRHKAYGPLTTRYQNYRLSMKNTRYFGSQRIFRTAILSDEECQLRYGLDLEPEARDLLRRAGCIVNENAPRRFESGLSDKADGICKRIPGLKTDHTVVLEIKTCIEEDLPERPTIAQIDQSGFHMVMYKMDCLLVIYNGIEARLFLIHYNPKGKQYSQWNIHAAISQSELPIGKIEHLHDIEASGMIKTGTKREEKKRRWSEVGEEDEEKEHKRKDIL